MGLQISFEGWIGIQQATAESKTLNTSGHNVAWILVQFSSAAAES